MYGPGPGPGFQPTPRRRPNRAVLVILRVVIVTLTMVSVGFLGWGAMLRIAVVRRRPVDWTLFGVAAALSVGSLVVMGSGASSEVRNVDVLLVGLNFLASIVISAYFLSVDIKHFGRYDRPPAVPYGPGHRLPPQQQPYGFGYQEHSTAQTRPTSQPPLPLQQPVQPVQPSHPPQQPQPSPASYQPPRIDQVRAELDELSDLLRKDQATRDDRATRDDQATTDDRATKDDQATREGRDGV